MRKRPIAPVKNGTSAPSSNTRRQIVPNIAAAGSISTPKWADIKPTASNAIVKEEKSPRSKDGRKLELNSKLRNRGMRSKNRGNDGQTTIVKSEGVFSCGIGDQINQHKSRGRHKQTKGEEIIIGKLETNMQEECAIEDVKKCIVEPHVEKKPKLENRKFSNAYEQLWNSDDEFDDEELKEINRENFITDLKKAEQMPFVLPMNEGQQFRKVIQRKRSDDNGDDGFEMISKNNEKQNPEQIDDQQAKFKITAKYFRGILNSNENPSPLMLFQIPSSILRVGQSMSVTGGRKTAEMAEYSLKNGDNIVQSQKQKEADQQNRKNCLEFFPAFSKIGKLQFLRNGRIVMNIGGNRMSISEAIPTDCFEALLRIENVRNQQNASADSFHAHPRSIFPPSPANREPIKNSSLPLGLSQHHSPGNLADFPSSSSSNSDGGNIAHLFSPMPYHFVCSFNIESILVKEMRRKIAKEKVPDGNMR